MDMDKVYGDWSGARNWWDNTMNTIGTFFGDVVRASGASIGNPQAAVPTNMQTPARMRRTPTTSSARPAATVVPSNLEAAGRMGGANAMPQGAPAGEAYGFDQFMADLLGMTGGSGGGVDLSGYNEMLADVAAREAGLGTRKGEQEAFLSALFDAAEQRMISDRDALAGTVQAALDADAARRATEIGLIRGDEANRLATATAAREALGVQGGEDLSSQVAQNAVAGVGASGSVAERDARINEAIQRQQLQSQIAGLTPMEQMAASQLSRGYEDRLAALASERAAIRNQMAQARSAASGRGGLGINEVLNAMGAYNEMFGPSEAPEVPGVLGFVRGAQAGTGQAGFVNDLVAIGDRIITSPTISRLDPTSPAGANEILQSLIASDPRVANIVNSNPGAAGFIIQYVTSAGKSVGSAG